MDRLSQLHGARFKVYLDPARRIAARKANSPAQAVYTEMYLKVLNYIKKLTNQIAE